MLKNCVLRLPNSRIYTLIHIAKSSQIAKSNAQMMKMSIRFLKLDTIPKFQGYSRARLDVGPAQFGLGSSLGWWGLDLNFLAYLVYGPGFN